MPNYKQGDIVLLPYPYSDLSTSKPRPAVILSKESFEGDFLVAKITPNLHNDSDSFLIESNYLLGVLPSVSEVRCNNISTIDKRTIMKKYAALNRNALQLLCAQIKTNFDVI
jgi:mRNA interferase MazF